MRIASILHRIRRLIKPMQRFRWHNIDGCVSYVIDQHETQQGTVLDVIVYENDRDRRGTVLIPKDRNKPNIIKVAP
jgi:hypothetical protein